jgi:hypothetical protein
LYPGQSLRGGYSIRLLPEHEINLTYLDQT